MELIYTDTSHGWLGSIRDFQLDMEWGDNENDFELTVPASVDIEHGSFVFEYGTEHGGVIDSKRFDNTDGTAKVAYLGRTWHGIMAKSIVRPDAGAAHLSVNGDVNDVIAMLLRRNGLSGVFEGAGPCGINVKDTIPRYISLWEALRRLTRKCGCRLDICRESGGTVVSAAPLASHEDSMFSDFAMQFRATRHWRPVNHMVCLGSDEMELRTVVDLYADAEGNVSQEQTFFGIDAVEDVYDYSNAGEDEEGVEKLIEGGTERLKELQVFQEVELNVPEGADYRIGDVMTAASAEVGMSVSAEVVKMVLSVGGDSPIPTIQYEVGEPAVTRSR